MRTVPCLALPLAVPLALSLASALGCSARTPAPTPDPAQCSAERCGPTPGMPNSPCADGTTMAGPTGRCLPTADGCGWEIVQCPEADAPAPATCHAAGCSGEVCADQDVVTTCEFRPEYACYKSAQCARQSDGACGWTPSSELDSCLADPPAP